jgi:hypothetical protein
MYIAKNGQLMKRIMTTMLAVVLIFWIPYPIPAHAVSDVTVNVDLKAPDGVSELSLGVTHTHFMWEEGDPAAVAFAKKLLIPAVKYQNQHIMGFGADNPQPASGGPFNFSSLDSRVKLMRSIGGDTVITFCTAPGWMKTSGQDWNMADRVADDHINDFANLAVAIAQRYPDVKYFQIWNEFKGYWDDSIKNSDGSYGNFDYVSYTQMYNAVYKAVKSARPDAKIGGFYLPLGGDGSTTLGYTGAGTYTPLSARDMDSLNYWLANKVGADFICVDYGLKDWFNPNHLNAADGLALTWIYKKAIQDIEAKTNLPIWFSEYYSLPEAAYNGSQWVATAMASIYLNMIKGGGITPITALLWNPEEGEQGCPNYLFTDTGIATGGQPTPHYYVYKGMRDYFPSETQLYTATSSDANVEVIASAAKTMLINKYNTSKIVSVNGVEYTLAAYEVRFVDAPASIAKVEKIVLKLNSTTVLVNGEKKILETAPTLIGSTTMVPLRFITEALGAHLVWNGEEKRITLTLNHDTVVIWINKTEAKVNSNTVMMAAPAEIVDGNTLVPVRFISENLKEEVNFNINTSEITITGKHALTSRF